jgi:hypothetical protein
MPFTLEPGRETAPNHHATDTTTTYRTAALIEHKYYVPRDGMAANAVAGAFEYVDANGGITMFTVRIPRAGMVTGELIGSLTYSIPPGTRPLQRRAPLYHSIRNAGSASISGDKST